MLQCKGPLESRDMASNDDYQRMAIGVRCHGAVIGQCAFAILLSLNHMLKTMCGASLRFVIRIDFTSFREEADGKT